MAVQRRSRYVRRSAPKTMVVQPRDVDIIESVYRNRVLSQAQIQDLFFGSKSTAQYRLERLFDNGYLDRLFLPVVQGEGRSPTLYILDKNGAETLRTERGYDDIQFYSSSKDITPLFLLHTLAISQMKIDVTVACRKYGFTLESWQAENEVKSHHDRVDVKDPTSGKWRSVPILPDSIFSIVANDRRHRCFLEVDRGTMTTAQFKKKVFSYIEYHESGKYEARYSTKSMRVLTVISTRYSGEKRLANLKAATEEVGGRHRFWFALAKAITPETVFFAPIWHIAGESENAMLLKP